MSKLREEKIPKCPDCKLYWFYVSEDEIEFRLSVFNWDFINEMFERDIRGENLKDTYKSFLDKQELLIKYFPE